MYPKEIYNNSGEMLLATELVEDVVRFEFPGREGAYSCGSLCGVDYRYEPEKSRILENSMDSDGYILEYVIQETSLPKHCREILEKVKAHLVGSGG